MLFLRHMPSDRSLRYTMTEEIANTRHVRFGASRFQKTLQQGSCSKRLEHPVHITLRAVKTRCGLQTMSQVKKESVQRGCRRIDHKSVHLLGQFCDAKKPSTQHHRFTINVAA